VDDSAAQPRPRATARVTKRTAPTDPRTGDRAGTRAASARPVVNASSATAAPVLPTSTVIDDPLLAPVQDGTPIEIPVIVPAQVEPEPEPDDAPTADLAAAAAVGTAVLPLVDDPTSNLPRPPEFTDADGTDGLPSLFKPKKPARALRPVTLPKARRPRVRRVTRVVRTVDTWSVFKVGLLFSLFLYAVLLTAGVLLWQVAQNTGTVDNVERFFETFGWETFELNGGAIYHNAWVGGLFLVVGLTGLCVLAATMFNLIADLVGGIRVTVLEEEVIAREERTGGFRWPGRRTGEPMSFDDADPADQDPPPAG
jgi:hypothetical protein